MEDYINGRSDTYGVQYNSKSKLLLSNNGAPDEGYLA
jgi:hypothetical protein